jgi:hypothetical protein
MAPLTIATALELVIETLPDGAAVEPPPPQPAAIKATTEVVRANCKFFISSPWYA